MVNKRTALWRATAFALTLAMLANPIVARAAGNDATASTPVVTETPAAEVAPDSTQTTGSTDATPSDSSDITSTDSAPSNTLSQDSTGTPADDTQQDELAADSTDTADTTDDTTDTADTTETDKNCWSTLEDGRICYLGEDGLPVTGEQQLPVDESDPEKLAWFYFDEDGALVTGWHTWDDGTRSYYEPSEDNEGYRLGAAHEGWDTIDGKTYYFNVDNKCHSYRWVQTIDGKMYYFDSDCHMWTGWLTWAADKTRSYFGEDGAAVSGWRDIDGKTYYIDPSSLRAVRWVQTIDGKMYYFDGSYAMVTGWVTWNADKTRSYFGEDGAAISGWQSDGSKRYYIDSKTLHTVRWLQVIDGKMYYFDYDCHMHTGWVTWNADKTRSYFGEDGAAISGWQSDGSKRYYIDSKTLHTVRWLQVIDGKMYYFDYDCHMHTGWVTWNADKTRSYFGSDGVALSGWQTIGGKKYYFNPDNSNHCLRWLQALDGKTYYFDGNGAMHTGWLKWSADGTYSYFGSDGAMYTGKKSVSGYTYNFGTDGKIKPVNGKIGYQNPSGFYQVSANKVRLPSGAYRTAFSYVTPPRITVYATRSDCVNAFLRRARQYKGTPYVWNYSRQPGVGVDCIGLVYQCAYACGMNLGEFNPWDHWRTGASGWHSHDANNFWNYGKAQRVSLKNRKKGDLIFWRGHVAIYMGNDRIIEAWPGTGVHETSLWAHGTPRGVKRLFQ